MGVLALCILSMKYLGMWWTFDRKINAWALARQLEVTMALFIATTVIYVVTVWVNRVDMTLHEFNFAWVFAVGFLLEYSFLITIDILWVCLTRRYYPGRMFLDFNGELKIHGAVFKIHIALYFIVLGLVLGYIH